MNYTGPKVKLSRKLGIALTPKAEKYMKEKPYPPGQHGPTKRKGFKMTDYKKQLLEKQKLRYQYDISEKQLRKYFARAKKTVGSTPEALVQLLESRLASIVHHGGLARSIFAARQYVTHGHFLVNNQKVNMPSYELKPGDIITLRDKSKKMQPINDAVKGANPPQYIQLNKPKMELTYLSKPPRTDIPVICDEILVIEYYSR